MSQIEAAAAAVDAAPYSLPARLDWADALETGGRGPVARWVRVCCGIDEAALPLPLRTRGLWTAQTAAFRGPERSEGLRNSYWQLAAPDGWPPSEADGFLLARPFFGRWVVQGPCDAAHEHHGWAEERLAAADRAGLLEAAAFAPQSAEDADALRDRAADLARWPVTLNLVAVGGPSLAPDSARGLLAAADWQELGVSSDGLTAPVRADVPHLAAGVRALRLEFPRRSRSLDGLWEGVPTLERLRFLSAVGPAFGDEEARRLADCPALKALDLASPQLTDDGLRSLAKVAGLAHLSVDSRLITRGGVTAFRAARPDVTLWLSRDVISEIGPA